MDKCVRVRRCVWKTVKWLLSDCVFRHLEKQKQSLAEKQTKQTATKKQANKQAKIAHEIEHQRNNKFWLLKINDFIKIRK